MKALVLKGKGNIAYIEKNRPTLAAAHGALLKPLLVSPCTSDVHTIWQGSPKRPDLTLGHEVIARVEEVGAEVTDFRVGDVVAVSAITPDWSQPDVEENYAHAGHNFSAHMLGNTIDGAFQELFYLPYADRNLARIPDGLTLEDALMCVDVLQTGFTAVEEAGVKPGDTVVVMGIGAIGLAAILGAKLAGARTIYAVGSRPENVRIAESMSDFGLAMSSDCASAASGGGREQAPAQSGCHVEVLNYRHLHCPLPQGMHPLANSTGSPVVNYVLTKTQTKGADKVLICGGDDLAFPQAIDMVQYGTGVVSNVMYYGADLDTQGGELKTLEAMNSAETYLTSTDAAVEAEAQATGDINVDRTTASASAAGAQPTSTLGSTAGAQPTSTLSTTGSASSKPTFAVPGDVLRKAHTVTLNDNIDCIQIPKFSIGRGMAGKTLKFSLSRGGRQNLERVMQIVQESGVHPSIFITEHYDGLDQIAQAIDDMKERKAIKIAVKI
ncbi:MAG: alcohol dehydrogenase catalytic domain-containing protein [Lachnospiraceae bacterium]|nr:alcohol dehydrogenase catalytic domain-containing protein [Lachnospiraceae bacterium]